MMQGPRRREAAFTLIELLAVVTIFALLAGFALPNVASLSQRQLRRAAEQLASQLELARQRSVVTAVPHRLLIDLDESAYRLEWQGITPEEAEAEAASQLLPPDPTGGRGPISLSPPVEAQRPFAPVPGAFGRATLLDPDLAFVGIETASGWVDRGRITIEFDRDGTAEYTEIVIDNGSGQTLVLDVLPLAEAVRIRDETT